MTNMHILSGIKAPKKTKFVFPPYEFDIRIGELQCSNQRVPLRPQAAEVLGLLLSKKGEVVSRKEIQQQLWGQTIVEFDQGLNFCIRQIRQALNDHAANPRFIETIPKKGYRFIASVTPQATRIRSLIAAGMAMLLVAIGTVGFINSRPPITALGIGSSVLGTEHSAARDAYIYGRTLLNEYATDLVPQSVKHFQKAIKIDPGYALAHAALAEAYLNPFGEQAISMPKARLVAQTALNLDPGLAIAHHTLGYIYWWGDWDWKTAEQTFRHASLIDKTWADPHRSLALLALAKGDISNAIHHMETSLELDPHSGLADAQAGWVFYLARQYQRAVDYCQFSLELSPDNQSAMTCLVLANYHMNNLPESVAIAEQILLVSGAENRLPLKGSGPMEKLQSFWRLELQRYHLTPVTVAGRHALLGNKQQAIHYLNKAYRQRSRKLFFISTHPQFDNIRDEPGYVELSAKIMNPLMPDETKQITTTDQPITYLANNAINSSEAG